MVFVRGIRYDRICIYFLSRKVYGANIYKSYQFTHMRRDVRKCRYNPQFIKFHTTLEISLFIGYKRKTTD